MINMASPNTPTTTESTSVMAPPIPPVTTTAETQATGFRSLEMQKSCRDFDRYHYCSRGIGCKYHHDYVGANQVHVLTYLDAIVADIANLKSRIFQLTENVQSESRSQNPDSSSRRSRYMDATMRRTRTRSSSRERLVSQDLANLYAPTQLVPEVEPLLAPPPSINPPHVVQEYLPLYPSVQQTHNVGGTYPLVPSYAPAPLGTSRRSRAGRRK